MGGGEEAGYARVQMSTAVSSSRLGSSRVQLRGTAEASETSNSIHSTICERSPHQRGPPGKEVLDANQKRLLISRILGAF